ncbi:Uncharacterized membrane protein HdeD, DUF308 family [Microbacterium saccharophilum]|uniref:Uncharacterized membrane protein HdeD, DUF308 family n=2 Tax=Microbacteriaceae TaxID=85023 RepID=A0A7Z7CXW2_9MICO|nr:Uncharacterized membrane protein HdeD, DUF308 family [Microbacterium saccharophilum]
MRRLPLARFLERIPPWLRAVIAAASVVLGVVIVIRPTSALGVLAVLLGGGMILAGILEFAPTEDESERAWWRTVAAAGWLLGGVFILLWPGITVRAVAVLVGLLLILSGALGVIAAFRRGRTWDARVADGAFGASGIVFGVLALFWPDITLLVVGVVFGARLIMDGIRGLWAIARRRRRDRAAVGPTATASAPRRRWGRTALGIGSVALAVTAVLVSLPLREVPAVVDDFYAAPRGIPDEPGRLIRAEAFDRDVPVTAQAWRILYTTTGVDGEVRAASGLVVVPLEGDGDWPVIDWNHGTTGFAQHCAPSLNADPFAVGAMYVLPRVIREGWALVATDYIGLGTEGPHPYLIGPPSAHASLDAVRAARELEDADLGGRTVIWGHSQGGGAALWAGALARTYAPEVWVQGVAALAPASDPPALVDHVTEVTAGSIFASFAFASFSAIYPDVTYRDYIRPGAQEVLRAMSERCLTDPATIVSVIAALGQSGDPALFSRSPQIGVLGRHLRANIPPDTITAPLLIGQGGSDTVVVPVTQSVFVDRLCRAEVDVDYRTYAGFQHAAVVEGYSPLIPELFEWTRARFAGEPTERGCLRSER